MMRTKCAILAAAITVSMFPAGASPASAMTCMAKSYYTAGAGNVCTYWGCSVAWNDGYFFGRIADWKCAWCGEAAKQEIGIPASEPNGTCSAPGVCTDCTVPTNWCAWARSGYQCEGSGTPVCETPGSTIHIQQSGGGEDDGASFLASLAAVPAEPMLVEVRVLGASYAPHWLMRMHGEDLKRFYSLQGESDNDAGWYFVTPIGARSNVAWRVTVDRLARLLRTLAGEAVQLDDAAIQATPPYTTPSLHGPRSVRLMRAGAWSIEWHHVLPVRVDGNSHPLMFGGGYARLLLAGRPASLSEIASPGIEVRSGVAQADEAE